MILNGQTPAAISAAAQALQAGRLIGLPTETVYGLAADADNDAAVAQIFSTKGRPADHPLIVHVADASEMAHFAHHVPDFAQALLQAFWPGPLTVILERCAGRANAATGGQASVGLRCPAHPVAHDLLCAARTLGVHGVAAPSANRFGRISPTTAHHVHDELGTDLLVLDGGACTVGIESTIIDCTRGQPVLLRPGHITRAQIAAACGQKVLLKEELQTQAPRASGTLLAHYAPRAQVRLMPAHALQKGLDVLGPQAAHLAVYARTPLRCNAPGVRQERMPDDAAQAAQALFATLRQLDDAQVRLIWVETPPPSAEWDGVRDRLERAAAAG